jgi:hypothetical protein
MPNEQFEEPNQPENYSSLKPVLRGQWQGGQSYFIDTISGGLATEFTPDETKREVVTTGVHDILYWVNKNDPTGPAPSNPGSDPQFHLWEAPVLRWAAEHPGLIPNTGNVPPPNFNDNVHTSQNSIGISVLSPTTSTTYDANASLTVMVSVSGPSPIKKVDYFINDTYIGTSENAPFSFSVTPSSVASISSLNELKAIATDSIFNKKEATMSFTVSGL